jgi:N-(2-amino-2-carboxyethyl)-L-glutamate synthase
MALHAAAGEIPRDATCVMIFPDRGERYLDTIYSDEWVRMHFGDVFPLFDEARGDGTLSFSDTGSA